MKSTEKINLKIASSVRSEANSVSINQSVYLTERFQSEFHVVKIWNLKKNFNCLIVFNEVRYIKEDMIKFKMLIN